MIAIVNVSDDGALMTGMNQYEVRINREVICEFDSWRHPDGLAQCLHDAGNAVTAAREQEQAELFKLMSEQTEEGVDSQKLKEMRAFNAVLTKGEK